MSSLKGQKKLGKHLAKKGLSKGTKSSVGSKFKYRLDRFLLGPYQDRDDEHHKKGEQVIHLSSLEGCSRKTVLSWSDTVNTDFQRERFPAKTMRIFTNGHYVHKRYQKWCRDMGILEGLWECRNVTGPVWTLDSDRTFVHSGNVVCGHEWYGIIGNCPACGGPPRSQKYKEVPVVSKKFGVKSSADGILLIDDERVVIDFKGMNSFTYREDKTSKYPTRFAYWIQLLMYCYFLKCRWGILFYENKDSQEVTYKVLDTQKYKKLTKANLKKIRYLHDSFAKQELPPRLEQHHCARCDFWNICWGNQQELIEKMQSEGWKIQKTEEGKSNGKSKKSLRSSAKKKGVARSRKGTTRNSGSAKAAWYRPAEETL